MQNPDERASARDSGGFRLHRLFSLQGRVGRGAYAAVGFGLTILKYLLDAGAVYLVSGKLWTPVDYLNPVFLSRSSELQHVPSGFHLWMALWTLPFLWIGVSMTLARLRDAGASSWWVLLFFVPLGNYFLMISLCFVPARPLAGRWTAGEDGGRAADEPPWAEATEGVDAASALVAAGVAAAAAVVAGYATLQTSAVYGMALFMGIPFVQGIVAGFLHNRRRTASPGSTLAVAALSTLLSGGLLLLFALEGAICIAMVLPVASTLALVGALVGRVIAGERQRSSYPAAFGLVAIPFLAAIEGRVVEPVAHEVVSSIEIDAPPEAVWPHVVAVSELPAPHWIFFRLGIAHPLRARIEGAGVGAVRRCEFSTGAFVEPITRWDEPERLSFDVIAQPPPMHEWSPYRHVHPPHLDGYWRSTRGEFRLIRLPDGRTRLEGSTWYELDIHPVPYWRVIADAIVHRIHVRVLDHVRAQVEGRTK